MDKDDLYMLRLMGEIDRNGITSQRELSRRLNVSLGLVNAFLNRLINKGYFHLAGKRPGWEVGRREHRVSITSLNLFRCKGGRVKVFFNFPAQ